VASLERREPIAECATPIRRSMRRRFLRASRAADLSADTVGGSTGFEATGVVASGGRASAADAGSDSRSMRAALKPGSMASAASREARARSRSPASRAAIAVLR
jgi:hypothetical protein